MRIRKIAPKSAKQRLVEFASLKLAFNFLTRISKTGPTLVNSLRLRYIAKTIFKVSRSWHTLRMQSRIALLNKSSRDFCKQLEVMLKPSVVFDSGTVCMIDQIIHQAHVSAIVETSLLKSGNGQKLRNLHDVVKQRMRALQAMKYMYNSLEMLVSPVTELNSDRSSMFV